MTGSDSPWAAATDAKLCRRSWNGTSTLFAALDVAKGEVMARHYKRRRRVEFLDFMNRIVAAHPDREIQCRARQPQHPQA